MSARATHSSLTLPKAPDSRRSRTVGLIGRLARNRTAAAGGIVLLLIIASAIFAPLITHHQPNDQRFEDYLLPPSGSHWFGTDEQGRDMFSRVVYGGRISLQIGLIAVTIAAVAGLALGLVAGYFGGWAETVIMRLMDVMLAFPEILLALSVVAILGPSLSTVMLAVGIASIPHYTRVVRATVLSIRRLEYIEAARVLGCSVPRILVRHILPNTFAPVLVMATTGVAAAIITGAALSFLGLGVQPPTAEWGSLLSGGRDYMRHAAWLTTYPGLAIVVTVVSINLLGDGLRDALDPKRR